MGPKTFRNWRICSLSKAPDDRVRIAVTGIGVASGLGYGKAAFLQGLFEARGVFSELTRHGREPAGGEPPFVGVELDEPPNVLPARLARTATLSSRVAMAVLQEAWQDAGLDQVDPERIGLVVGSSNPMSREQALAAQRYEDKLEFVPPRHGHMFLSSDIAGLCTSVLPIRGFSQSVDAASASGSVAVIQAMDAVRSGRVDVCIALGALQDLSGYDLHAMRSLGVMGGADHAARPGEACRPMDLAHNGFIYGEASAALVLMRKDLSMSHNSYGDLIGAGHIADGSRGPEPNSEGQVRAALNALAQAGLTAKQIDFVNGHATGTPQGDFEECRTYHSLELHYAWINATKSIVGHGMSAAGALELAAVLLQIKEGRLHPTRNLENPIDEIFDWVKAEPVSHEIRHALKFSFGFGGINTALVIAAP